MRKSSMAGSLSQVRIRHPIRPRHMSGRCCCWFCQLNELEVSTSKSQLTATFESLAKQSVQHGATVVAERRRHVIVNGEVMRNVDVESRCQHLQSTNSLFTFVNFIDQLEN